MTSSSDPIHELRAARPAAPPTLRARVRELAATATPHEVRPARTRFRAFVPQFAVVGLLIVTVGAIGLVGTRNTLRGVFSDAAVSVMNAPGDEAVPEAAPSTQEQRALAPTFGAADSATSRAQRVGATLTVEVRDPNAVSRAAQDALDLTRSLGGYVVSSSVTTGEQGNASLTVRVPVARVQDAIAGLSELGRIVSQQVSVEDLQQQLDQLEHRRASLVEQVTRITARLETEDLDAETTAALEARRRALRNELRTVRSQIAGTNAEARMSTIQLAIVTPDASGAVVSESRIDRTIDGALNVLAWEGVVALGVLIILAPFALVGLAVWFGRRVYRRHEEERLLAT
jgi:Domain of unknown function (DUF4349)